MKESLQQTPDDHYKSPNGEIEITVDFDDPEERAATIWCKASTEDEINTILHRNWNWVCEVFAIYDVDPQDGTPVSTEEEDGGFSQHCEFPPDEYHDEDDEY